MILKKWWLFYQPLLLVFAVISACEKRDGDLIVKVLENREEAIARKSLPDYLNCISSSYWDFQGRDREHIGKQVQDIFENFAEIRYYPQKRLVYTSGNTATVVQDFVIHYQFRTGETVTQKGRERLILRKEKGKWKIIDGL